uniref:Uncharacterized protein n=1 Tax=Podoviridae sp. ct8Lf7 TaxID=2827723 RepID=A0A8S5S0Q5_9CAUD|nr:MAG TPA: hypothetical protein [Podoviridae sp. ct8Lf7]
MYVLSCKTIRKSFSFFPFLACFKFHLLHKGIPNIMFFRQISLFQSILGSLGIPLL